jgi:hypothetical protein
MTPAAEADHYEALLNLTDLSATGDLPQRFPDSRLLIE